MSTAKGPWPGRFVWHDLMTTDDQKALAFYTGLFDYRIESRPMTGCVYHMIHLAPGPMGGIMLEKGIPQSNWLPHIAVANVDATAAKIPQLGGKIFLPPTDIPDTGRFAIVIDPYGAYFSIYQALPQSPGFDPEAMVPGRICWNELMTSDPIGAQKFYGAVFGWTDQTMPMGDGATYHIQKLGEAQAAGIMKHPQPGAPSCWIAYFFVEDLARATERAKQLGATVMMANQPIPGIGAFSFLADPTGAMLSLFQPAMPGSAPDDCGA